MPTLRLHTLYDELGTDWLLDHAPAALLRPGPGALLWAQWLALPLLILAGWLVAAVIARITRLLWAPIIERNTAGWADTLLDRTAGPVHMLWTLAVVYVALPWLGLVDRPLLLIERGVRGVASLALFWTLLRCVDVAIHVLADSPWARSRAAARSILPLGARLGKVVIFLLAVVAIFSQLGYPVTTLIAGLGLGGLAVALAAQKTLENLLGAVAIAVDQPFREGDVVKIDGLIGSVETIGLRATRIRTPDRTLVSIPNGKLAEMRLETYSVRDRIRLGCTLGLAYDTSAAQMRGVLAGMEQVLREQPKIWPEQVVVRFIAVTQSSLDIEVNAWFTTTDWNEFLSLREDTLLRFMDVVEAHGASFAFPSSVPRTQPSASAPADRALG